MTWIKTYIDSERVLDGLPHGRRDTLDHGLHLSFHEVVCRRIVELLDRGLHTLLIRLLLLRLLFLGLVLLTEGILVECVEVGATLLPHLSQRAGQVLVLLEGLLKGHVRSDGRVRHALHDQGLRLISVIVAIKNRVYEHFVIAFLLDRKSGHEGPNL